MSGRRGFLRNVGFLGLFGTGATLAQGTDKEKTSRAELEVVPVEELDSNKADIIFNSTYGEIDTDKIKNSPFSLYGDQKYKPETIKKVEVTLKVGPDGKLYVKENDIWRKV
jgi:hypothetical protein